MSLGSWSNRQAAESVNIIDLHKGRGTDVSAAGVQFRRIPYLYGGFLSDGSIREKLGEVLVSYSESKGVTIKRKR